jgi:multisubunit Na+/H+ antiporter MnhB subunit
MYPLAGLCVVGGLLTIGVGVIFIFCCYMDNELSEDKPGRHINRLLTLFIVYVAVGVLLIGIGFNYMYKLKKESLVDEEKRAQIADR